MKRRYLILAGLFIVACFCFLKMDKAGAIQDSSWSAMNYGFDGPVQAFAIHNNEIYAGGDFTGICNDAVCSSTTIVGHVAKWNGSSWQAVGTGMNGAVMALMSYNNELYAGGDFSTADGAAVFDLAKWDGTNWESVSLVYYGVHGDGVYDLEVYNNELYVAGSFGYVCNDSGCSFGDYYQNIAKWNGSSWATLDYGFNGMVYGIEFHNNELYAGGGFLYKCDNADCSSQTIPINKIAKWNGLTWEQIGYGLNGNVWTTEYYNNGLYAGGEFTTVCMDSNCGVTGTAVSKIAKWNGSSWESVGNGFNTTVRMLRNYHNYLYAGGDFTLDGSLTTTLSYFARLNSSNSWEGVNGGMNGPVYEMFNSGYFYLGGGFTQLNSDFSISSNRVIRWYTDATAPTTIASPAGGTYSSAQIVTLIAIDDDSAVTATYYTLDGSDPTASSSVYLSPITINTSKTLKFFSVDSLGNTETVKTEGYIILTQKQIQEENLKEGKKVTLIKELDNQTISGQDLTLYFKKLPNKLTKNSKYWMKWKKLKKYPNKTFLKKWKLTTNLHKYKAKKLSQKFKIKVTFRYTKKTLKKFLKKNKLATKSNITLKYKRGKSSWKNLTSIFTDAKLLKKNKKFVVRYFTNFPVRTQYFAIGVK